MTERCTIIDDFRQPAPQAAVGSHWELIGDAVMGGRSTGSMTRESLDGRPVLRLRGSVSLENNGGFVQIALNLAPDGSTIDASPFCGIEIDVAGNGERYGMHLRTADVARPPDRAGRHRPGLRGRSVRCRGAVLPLTDALG